MIKKRKSYLGRTRVVLDVMDLQFDFCKCMYTKIQHWIYWSLSMILIL